METGRFIRSREDLEGLVVGVNEQRPVYLRQVAEVTDGPTETTSMCGSGGPGGRETSNVKHETQELATYASPFTPHEIPGGDGGHCQAGRHQCRDGRRRMSSEKSRSMKGVTDSCRCARDGHARLRRNRRMRRPTSCSGISSLRWSRSWPFSDWRWDFARPWSCLVAIPLTLALDPVYVHAHRLHASIASRCLR